LNLTYRRVWVMQEGAEITTSHLKDTSNAQLRCCEPLRNAHILPCMLRFFIGSRLVLERDLHF
jgi:hypothetical protein